MTVYLLWFNEWEANYCLGIFETEIEAQRYKNYFIKYPIDDKFGPDMAFYSTHEGYEDRFVIEPRVIGHTLPTVDNLHLLEFIEEQKRAKENA